MKIKDAQTTITNQLLQRGVDSAARETELMLCHILGCERLFLFMHGEDELTKEDENTLALFFCERMVGRPLQYLLKSAPFMGLELYVNENVLIPRPETELLAEEAAAFLKEKDCPRVLDLCTGSGALAAYLASSFENAEIDASDVSVHALDVARKNCPENVNLVHSDLFEKLPGSYDLIVTNPPYVTDGEYEELQPEVKNYEPRLALTAGADGLDIIRRILQDSLSHLNDKGMLLMEIGCGQGAEVLALAEGFSEKEIIKDLNGLDRILKAKK